MVEKLVIVCLSLSTMTLEHEVDPKPVNARKKQTKWQKNHCYEKYLNLRALSNAYRCL